jgi:hypothetical protein
MAWASGPGRFVEASYWSFNKNGDIIAGDTSVSGVTVIGVPQISVGV